MTDNQLLHLFYNTLMLVVSQLQKREDKNQTDRAVIREAEKTMQLWRERKENGK